MKQIIFLILLCLIVSCSLSKSMLTVIGEYECTDDLSFYSCIRLKSDSTFEYRKERGWLSLKSEGAWKLDGNHVVLNSFKQQHEKGYEIIDGLNIVTDSITLKVIDVRGNDSPLSKVRFVKGNKTSHLLLGFDSTLKILKSTYDSIYIQPFYCPEIGIAMCELANDRITVKLDQGFVYYSYMLNEKWLFKRNRLYSSSFKRNNFKKANCYERVDSIITIIPI